MLQQAVSSAENTIPVSHRNVVNGLTTYHYSAATEHGPVGLSITGGRLPAPSNLNLLLELSKQEPLLLALEDWLQTGLDFNGQATPMTRTPLISLRSAYADFVQIDVSVPVPLWAYRELNLAELEKFGFQTTWHEYHARLMLGELPLSDEDRNRLQQGALVLIPDSFLTEWKVNLCVPALKYMQAGLLVKDLSCWQGMHDFTVRQAEERAEERASAQTSGNTEPEDAACYFEISTRQLLSPPAELQEFVNSKLKHSVSTIRSSDGTRASGKLINVGSGYGLQITRLFGSSL
jgi:hypothetical protein